MGLLCNIDKFNIKDKLKPSLDTFNCSGIDYAMINESFTWNAPLIRHKFANRYHINGSYRYQDPYHHYGSVMHLPRLCNLAEISVHAKAWGELFSPELSKYGDCHAVSYHFFVEGIAHRFLMYFDNIHNISNLYLRITELHQYFEQLAKDIVPLTVKFFDDFVIYCDELNPLPIPPQWFDTTASCFDLRMNELNEKGKSLLELVGSGVEKRHLPAKMNLSSRTIDKYIKIILDTLCFKNYHELNTYAKRYLILNTQYNTTRSLNLDKVN